MRETLKTLNLLLPEEKEILKGSGIDVGCGNTPVTNSALGFDMENGDANYLTHYIDENKFDFLWSSHCLEHMNSPSQALLEWWKVIKPGGYLLLTVPDEDLYEQGFWPSRFNPDHKHTFTLCKQKSWSPVSCNILELIQQLPGSKIMRLALQDCQYNRNLYRHGQETAFWKRPLFRILSLIFGKKRFCIFPKDQTLSEEVCAQIFCCARKETV